MPRTTKKTPDTADPKLLKLQGRYPAWKLHPTGTSAVRTVVFPRHVDAVVFIARIAIRSEVAGVHPSILLTRARAEVTVGGDALGTKELAVMSAVDELCPYGDKRVPKKRSAGILKASKK